jgi:hypothetical protein
VSSLIRWHNYSTPFSLEISRQASPSNTSTEKQDKGSYDQKPDKVAVKPRYKEGQVIEKIVDSQVIGRYDQKSKVMAMISPPSKHPNGSVSSAVIVRHVTCMPFPHNLSTHANTTARIKKVKGGGRSQAMVDIIMCVPSSQVAGVNAQTLKLQRSWPARSG